MTYSRFQFLPLRVVVPQLSSHKSKKTSADAGSTGLVDESNSDRYRLLKFADARDPRHQHFQHISGSMVENYESQSASAKRPDSDLASGRLLELNDNWCLLPSHEKNETWNNVPYPHRGHPVLYVPGHWGSFSQARSLGAHGTRWTGPYPKGNSDQEIYESLRSGKGMHDGWLTDDAVDKNSQDWIDALMSTQQYLDGFVMDIFALDFDGGEGAALHSSKLLRQAEFFARAVETIIKGCRISVHDKLATDESISNNSQNEDIGNKHGISRRRGITIVAHSIGAWVVRIALKMHPHLESEGWIRNVVTLASPLGGVPYAVDAGVHDIVQHLNDEKHSDVSIISISGGLRDEMIPPESCEVPPNAKRDGRELSETFLANSITKAKPNEGGADAHENSSGMDHRAIVWCYDLLKVVREVIFSLVIATDQGQLANERMEVARTIMRKGMKGTSGDKQPQSTYNSTISSYQKDVSFQRDRAFKGKTYPSTIAIQLSAPYHLNSLLKLCILVALFHSTVILPTLRYLRRGQGLDVINKQSTSDHNGKKVFMTTCIDAALSTVSFPIIVLGISWLRQLELPLGSNSGPMCINHECQLLFGTVFVLAQLVTILYFIILNGALPLVAAVRNKLFRRNKSASEEIGSNSYSSDSSFLVIFAKCCTERMSALVLQFLPFTISAVCIIHIFVFNNSMDLVWNKLSIASYCFMSFIATIMVCIIKMACHHSLTNQEELQSALIILLLSLVKATFGKVLYAFSLTTKWGQTDMSRYSAFLTTMNSKAGMIGGHHNEMMLCFLTLLFPAFISIMAIQTHSVIYNRSMSFWSKAKKCDDSDEDNTTNSQLDVCSMKISEPKFLGAANGCLVCWYAWSVFVSHSGDDLIIPFFSATLFVRIYFMCNAVSPAALGIFSAIVENDLSLQSNSPDGHNKKE